MAGDRKKVVRPVPVLSVAGSFRPSGEVVVACAGTFRPDDVVATVEGHLFLVRGDVKFPAGPGHHHMKRRNDRNVWHDIL